MLIYVNGNLKTGKATLINYFLKGKGFTLINYNSTSTLTTELSFDKFEDFFNFITVNYDKNFIFSGNLSFEELTELKKRPYFYFIWLEAPINLRFDRFLLSNDSIILPEFLKLSDDYLYYNQSPPLFSLVDLADITIHNPFNNIEDFEAHLDLLDLTHPDRLRPSWDTYFILLTQLASLRSNCMKRRVGCIIVKDNRVIATGYNGTPKGIPNCNEGGCIRCNTNGGNLDSCICIHAEENAMLEAGRERTSSGKCILYCNTCPCLGCAKKIIQMGINEVVYSQTYKMDSETNNLFELANIKVRKHLPSDIKLFTGI